MNQHARRRQAGFTLIELMVVVGIIGILASVAIPNYEKLLYRSKTAERTTIMNRVKQQVQEVYIRNGTTIDPVAYPNTPTLPSEINPPLPPTAHKRMMTTDAATVPVWAEYFHGTGANASISQEIEGSLYYSYQFVVNESPANASISVVAVGDLDGDGLVSTKQIIWTRINGVYQITFEDPPLGQEDATTF